MRRPDLRFAISGKVWIHVDLERKRVVISCVTKDGKLLDLETDYQTLDQIHREIQKHLEGGVS